MKEILEGIRKRITKREMAGLIMLAILLTASLRTGINMLVDHMLPIENVTIRRADNADDRCIFILYEQYANNEDELFLPLKEENESSGDKWTYVEGIPNESWTMLYSTGESKEINISVKRNPRKYVTFMLDRTGGLVEIESSKGKLVYDTYLDGDSQILRVHLFKDSKLITAYKLAVYAVSFVIVLLCLSALYLLFKYRVSVPSYLLKPVGVSDFFICFLLFLTVSVIFYRFIGIPNYLQFGDEGAYWNTTVIRNGKFDLDYLAAQFAPRGYWCYTFQYFAHLTGRLLSVNPVYPWLVFMSILWSTFFCGIFTGLFEQMRGEKAKRIHILVMVLIFLVIQRMYLTSVLMDSIGMVTFFAFIYFLCRTIHGKSRVLSGILAGIFGMITCSLRMAHFVGVIGFTVYYVVRAIVKKENLKKVIPGIVFGVLAFLILCIPQFMINMHRNSYSLLPPNTDGILYGQSTTTWSSDYALAHGNVAYPLLATDD